MPTFDQVKGCLLGLALGDALGAPYEGGIVERTLWRVIGVTRSGELRWTDDTQMSIDVAESFVATGDIDSDDLAQRFSKSYRWSRGYGRAVSKLLKRIVRGADWREANRSVYPNGSFGNGAAMRAPLIGLIYADRPQELVEAARRSAVVTHCHPLGIAGAVVTAQATAGAVRNLPARDIWEAASTSCVQLDAFTSRLAVAREWLESQQDVSWPDVVSELGHGIAAHKSCVTAMYLAYRFQTQTFESMLQFIIACGGDVDTIGAMAGAIWGAANGYEKLPAKSLQKLEQHDRLLNLATRLHQQVSER